MRPRGDNEPDTPEIPRLRVALDVLRLRWEAPFDAAAPLLDHPEPGVRSRAARCLAVSSDRAAALEILERLFDEEGDDRVFAAVAESLLVLGSPVALPGLRTRLHEEIDHPGEMHPGARLEILHLIALAGDATDTDLLLRSCNDRPEEASALGWFGHTAVVPYLVAAEERATDPALRHACGLAIHRISGLVPHVAGAEEDLPPISAEGPAGSGPWSRRWQAEHGRFEVGRKIRFGRLFSPLVALDEAEAGGTRTDVRRICALELSLLSRGASRFHVRDWVARQQAALADLRARFSAPANVGEPAYVPGAWPASRIAPERRS